MDAVGFDDSVLRKLEKSLEEIELYSDNEDDACSSDEYDDASEDENHQPEHELSEMMDSLVAELQVEIQQQRVHERDDTMAQENLDGSPSQSKEEFVHLLLDQLVKKQKENNMLPTRKSNKFDISDNQSVASSEAASVTASQGTSINQQRSKKKRRQRRRRSIASESTEGVRIEKKNRKPRTNKHIKKKRLERLLVESVEEEYSSSRENAVPNLSSSMLWKMLYQAAMKATSGH